MGSGDIIVISYQLHRSGNTGAGGSFFTYSDETTLTHSIVSNNSSTEYCRGGMVTELSTTTLTNFSASGNSSVARGGLFTRDNTDTLSSIPAASG
jgi:hypothetical protein